MTSLVSNVRDQVHYCFDTLAESIGADLTEKPDVEVYFPRIIPSFLSSGCNHKGDITIVERDIGRGAAYFEEVSHSLRTRLNPSLRNLLNKKFPKLVKNDNEVDEFFGRLGVLMGMELVKNTNHEHLFDGYEPMFLSDMNELESRLNAFVDKEEFSGNTVLYANYDQIRSGLLNHCIGYIAAELFINGNHEFMEEAKQLFRRTNRHVRKNYIDIDDISPYRELIEPFK